MSCCLVIYFWLYIMGSVVKTRHKETSTPFNTDVPIRIVSLISWVQKCLCRYALLLWMIVPKYYIRKNRKYNVLFLAAVFLCLWIFLAGLCDCFTLINTFCSTLKSDIHHYSFKSPLLRPLIINTSLLLRLYDFGR